MTKRLLAFALCACNSPPSPSPPPPVVPRDAALAAALPVPTPAFEAPAPADPIARLFTRDGGGCVVRKSGFVDCWRAGGIERMRDVTQATAIVDDDEMRCLALADEVVCRVTRDGKSVDHHLPIARASEIVLSEPSCALAAGRVACWGDDFRPHVVPALRDVVSLADADHFTCAVLADGHVQCASGDRGRWYAVGGLADVTALVMVSGGDDCCSVDADACALVHGDVRCFELGGEVGKPLAISEAAERAPDKTALAALHGASALAWRDGVELAGLVGGRVVLAGSEAARTVPKLGDAVAITADCALRAQGSVVCWGARASGQPFRETADRPVPVVGVADVVSVATNDEHSWAVTRDGQVYKWGGHAQLVPQVRDAVAVALGPSEITPPCFLRRDGGVTCLSDPGDRPIDIGLAHAIEVRADGRFGYVVLLADGTQRAVTPLASENEVAAKPGTMVEIVAGTRAYKASTVAAIPGAVEIVGTVEHQYARDAAGRVLDVLRAQPPVVLALPHASALAAGANGGCAIVDHGAVWCWTDKAPPAPVHGVAGAVAIRGSETGFCAELADGSLTCSDPSPHLVLPPGSLAGAFVGGSDGCTIRKDGLAACWGDNRGGRLGDGSIVKLDSPAAVPGLP